MVHQQSPVGTVDTNLIIIRGNSASGKSSVARTVRERYGYGLAWVSQDILRRTVLRERDAMGAHNIGLIDLTIRYALDRGFQVILDGILHPPHYAEMIMGLARDHRGRTTAYYLDVDLAETVRRHHTKPEVTAYGEEQLQAWFVENNLIEGLQERLVDQASSLDQTVQQILDETSLLNAPRPHGPGLPTSC